MKNIVFVFNPGCFPVPAINGGAIESLITTLIDENEKEKKFMFHVIMCKNISDKYEYDYSKYQFTKFYNFYQSSLKFKIGRIINAVNKRLNYALPLYSSFENYLLSTIDEINPDFIVFEGTFNSTVRKLRKKYDKDKLVLHVHHKICPKYKIDNFFGRMWCVSDYIKRDWQESKVLKEDFKYQIFNNVLTSKTFNNELSDEERNQLMKQYNLKKDDFVLAFLRYGVYIVSVNIL